MSIFDKVGGTFDEEPEKEDDGIGRIAFAIAPDGLPAPVVEAMPESYYQAIPDNLVCLDGPCRNYREVLSDSPDRGDGRELRRYCTALSTATELMDLSDGVVFACSFYRPPFWSLTGRARAKKIKATLKAARDTLAGKDGVS